MKEISTLSDDYLNNNLKYIKLLSKQYPSISKASEEIINLEELRLFNNKNGLIIVIAYWEITFNHVEFSNTIGTWNIKGNKGVH